MDNWKIEYSQEKHDLKGANLIAGLPGIGNVGKIVSDFLVEELKAGRICDFFSYSMPHSVFIREDNLIDMPKIQLYYSQKNNLLILTGDAQPVDEKGCYSFCDTLLDFFQENKCNEIITLGGIGLATVPKKPIVYCTGNDKEIIERYKSDTGMSTDIYGIVGPIIGVSGLLLGLSSKRNIKSASILAETLGHPMYLGLKGSREILKIISKKLNLEITLENLEKEIKDMESKMKVSEDLGRVSKRKGDKGDVSYIG